MAPLLEDPRIRRTWNQISQNAESATENAAAGIWTFQHKYINPCFASIASCFEQCTDQCLPDREERARRLRERGRTRGRAELSFDFYDDWDQDDSLGGGGLLGWGNDELDRLLAGSGSHSGPSDGVDRPPRRKRGMSYGTRGRRKSLDPDPTVIPSTSALGFLGRLPFKFGGTLRYKPSAADLQEHPGASRSERRGEEEGEPLISEEYSEEDGNGSKAHNRQRSSTTSSGETSGSFRSRGDLFPSDGEDDAVPLDDEFAMVLERRMTLSGADDRSSGKTRSSIGKGSAGSRNVSGRTLPASTRSKSSLSGQRKGSGASLSVTPDILTPEMAGTPSLTDLQKEEERIKLEEDAEVERKREAAARLAIERGLHVEEDSTPAETSVSETKLESPAVDISAPITGNGHLDHSNDAPAPGSAPLATGEGSDDRARNNFVPARLPNFG